ncbi:hypothetical protein EVAR_53171_1 [Eumeta japonica]|uniref:Uncharacterized protein n=1 Tax=Eumeta variegata TaxID=151549 RepID=A0A4C1YU54_EUMVA|nr:hypothetical protein EVAR_53171_1 [Eumeta japonica]
MSESDRPDRADAEDTAESRHQALAPLMCGLVTRPPRARPGRWPRSRLHSTDENEMKMKDYARNGIKEVSSSRRAGVARRSLGCGAWARRHDLCSAVIWNYAYLQPEARNLPLMLKFA